MTNVTTYPLIDAFETTLSQSWNWATGTVYVNDTPAFTFPSGVTTYIVVNPGKTNMQVAKIDSYDANASTFNVSSISVDKWASVAYSQQSHAAGSKVIISDNYQFWKDIVDSIATKLDSNGGNATTTFNLSVTGSNFRIRKDGNDMKFRDDNTPEVALSTLAAASWADQKVSVSNNDTTPGTLDQKITFWDGLSGTINNPGWNENYEINIDRTNTDVFKSTSAGAWDSTKIPILNGSGKLDGSFINGQYQAATDSDAGVLEIATQAEATARSATDKIITPELLPKQAILQTTRLMSWANGSVNVAHWLGVIPKYAQVYAIMQQSQDLSDWAANPRTSFGYSNGSTNMCSYIQWFDSWASAKLQAGNDASNVVHIQHATSTWEEKQVATITFDATNIIFAWTRSTVGSDPASWYTIYITILAST